MKDFTVEELKKAFEEQAYILEQDTVVTVFLALKLEKPLLVEGPPGVGKTEIAKALSRIFQAELIRLQCYEGLDENKALYEWNYQRQLIRIQLGKAEEGGDITEEDLFSETYLLERPLLKAIRTENKPVLLIDEIDKTDEEFEAFLFEILSDFQISIPELGTIKAKQIPIVVLTSNAERDLSDGLKRRCVYLYVDYPSIEKELRIIRARVPGVGEQLSREVAQAVNYLRTGIELKKKPSISETLDWAKALVYMDADRLDPALVESTINVLLKNKEDLDIYRQELGAAGLLSAMRSPDCSCRHKHRRD
ncbi:ATPase AAA [Thermincola ferriacetica]|uniref:ATPase AAA n=1 Tax=Thermincola ferriacetica TaxID=281456 RepID=A0A0L6VZH8_9FIRM|nr:MoxR family ATPase [Thermincola ferriacetica]KNZ68611.1 ATPase AAA [Thermincola ferriacetica]